MKTEKEKLEFLGIKKKLVVLTGAGISAESGIQTFRSLNGGLWYDHDPSEVATITGWRKNPQKVLDFYNVRRADLVNAQPNAGHIGLKELEDQFDVVIITQNVDDLHEKAGSTNVMHLHGKLQEMKGNEIDEILPYDKDIKIGDLSPSGAQYRPNVVWFGESVPMIPKAKNEAYNADIFVVIGTSLEVYPAASLIYETKMSTPIFVIDPENVKLESWDQWTGEKLSIVDKTTHIKEPGSTGVYKLIEMLKESN